LRPIGRDDKAKLEDLMGRPSPASRRYRLLSPLSVLTESMLVYLTEIDYFDHFAWAAVAAERAW
jgi:hypothetical protein